METTVKVKDLTALGDIAVGDKILGERLPGQTRSITYTPKIMTGTINQVTVINGDQVAGNPVFSISVTYPGQTSITTLGTIGTGVWQAATLEVGYGGTGLTSTTANKLLYSSANNVIAELATANDSIVKTNGAGVPSVSTDIPTAVTVGGQYIYRATGTDVPLADGGTNASLTANNGGIVYSNATQLAILAGNATANKMMLSGASTAPTWSTSTIPTSAGATALKHLRSDGTNYILTSATISDTPSTAGKVMISDGTNWITSTPTFPNASATTRKIIVSDGANWVASTETHAAPGASGNVLTSDGTNWLSSAPASTTTAASQAQQEAASSTTVFTSPGTQKYHPGSAKAWVKFGVTGDILASYNVSSIADNGVGSATVSFTTFFSSAQYATAGLSQSNGASTTVTFVDYAPGFSAAACTLKQATSDGTLTDPTTWSVVFFGDQ